MAVPTLDLTAFEATIRGAHNFVARILQASPITSGIAANDRLGISRVVDRLEQDFALQRDAVAATAEAARSNLEAVLSGSTLSEMREFADVFERLRLAFAALAQHARGTDAQIVAHFVVPAELSHDAAFGGFVGRERARLQAILDERQSFLRQADEEMRGIVERIDAFVARNSVRPPASETIDARAAAQDIEHDIENVSGRTRDLIARFPKTAAYLAR